MRRRVDVIIQILTLLVLWVAQLPLFAQAPKPPSLKEQLEAQYQQPGTVLVIQKAGILGIPSASKATCATRYQGGKLTPDASCTAPKPLTVGERVYLSKIEVDVAEGKISVRIAECDSCNKVKFSSCKSQIDFQFDKGYLEKASVSEVKGTISKVLSFDQGGDQQPAQGSKPPSLKEQLEAQYPPGTVLAIQKEGILGIAPTSGKTCAAKYQNKTLNPPDASCATPLKNSSKPLAAGKKVYPSKIDVDLAKEQISFRLVEKCDSCSKTTDSSYNSQVDFKFAKGYLEQASVSTVEDIISEVLVIDEGGDQPSQPVKESPAVQEKSGEAPSEVLTNSGVVKMAKANLGDGIILRKIKASACKFDTSADALGELKKAGVSEPVINAMLDVDEASKAAAREPVPVPPSETETTPGGDPPPSTAPAQLSFSVRHRHRAYDVTTWKAVDYYCSGTLSVSPDGTVAYDCAQTDDPGGRCDHVSFAPGALKQAKIGSGGSLHVESKTQGKFDFYGDQNEINQAVAAIAPLVQATQK